VKISELSDALTSKIASITIRRADLRYGVAHPRSFWFRRRGNSRLQVGSLKISLLTQPFNDGFVVIGSFNDVRIHELLAS
jgi:hypothetical protein